MTLNRAARAERRAQAAAMVRSGMSIRDVAAQFGVCPQTVRAACCMHAAVRPDQSYARNVHESMDAPEWDGICLYRRATAEACRRVATWASGNCLACDEHRDAMHCGERLRRMEVAG